MNNDSARLQACDGVTTQLELELGTWPVDTFLAEREAQGAVINFGSSVGHIPTRGTDGGGHPVLGHRPVLHARNQADEQPSAQR